MQSAFLGCCARREYVVSPLIAAYMEVAVAIAPLRVGFSQLPLSLREIEKSGLTGGAQDMNQSLLIGRIRFVSAAAFLLSVAACGSSGSNASSAAGAAEITSASAAKAAVLVEDKSNILTLGVKYVAFSVDGAPVLSQQSLGGVIERVNMLYTQCGIEFRLDEYVAEDPAKYGLGDQINSGGNMVSIRAPFYTEDKLTIVGTGAWNHSGGPANAWAAMPGESPMGIVMESTVVDNSNIVAHELGHYLSLDHLSNTSNLMNPIIYDDSTQLSDAQCADMRKTAVSVHLKALR